MASRVEAVASRFLFLFVVYTMQSCGIESQRFQTAQPNELEAIRSSKYT